MSYEIVDRIVISHLHFDHLGGFFMLIQGFWLEGRKKPLSVHMPADGIGPVREMLRAACIFDELLAFPLHFHALEPGKPIPGLQARITPHPTTHLSGLRRVFQSQYPQAYASFAFLIEANGFRIVHSADLGAPEDLKPLLSEPVNLLVCELSHFRPDDLFRFLRRHPVKQILFTHLSSENWDNLESLRAHAARILEIPFCFAQDNSEYSFEVPVALSELGQRTLDGTPKPR